MKLIGIARVGNDPKIRQTKQGKDCLDLSLAFDYGMKDEKKTQWVSATLWGERCKAAEQYIAKGDQVFLTLGDVHIDTFTGRDGEARTSLKATVQDFQFIGGKKKDDPENSPAAKARREYASNNAAVQAPPSNQMDDDIPW
jgi:single-strand DNA-binding protein